MIWLLRDFDLLSVLLRAATFSFEAMLLGGIAYMYCVARPCGASGAVQSFCLKGIRWAAVAMILGEMAAVSVSCALLVDDSPLQWKELFTAEFVLAGICVVLTAGIAWWTAHRIDSQTMRVASGSKVLIILPLLGILLLAAVVSTSHAASRMDHRLVLLALTAAHHLGMAIWLGAMPFLLISLGRAESIDEARRAARRYSSMALVGASTLLLAGIGLAWVYVAAWNGLYQTTYGVTLLAKTYLFVVMAFLGAGNWLLLRRLDTNPQPLLARLRRVAESEIGIGFTAVLAAACLVSQPPSVDVTSGRPTLAEIQARMHPEIPRMTSPAAAKLAPPTSIDVAVQASEFGTMAASDANDRAWSEYNHHWAGVVVLMAGLLALLSRLPAMRWARFWPLAFAGLAVFILLRADPENWPVGPRPFWASFYASDVLLHRSAALLIFCFAVFECAVQAGKLKGQWAALVFPGVCALGAALLLAHNHASSDPKEDVFAQLSHTPIAVLGATIAWSRWLELRLPRERAARIAACVWPACLALAGLILLNYREM